MKEQRHSRGHYRLRAIHEPAASADRRPQRTLAACSIYAPAMKKKCNGWANATRPRACTTDWRDVVSSPEVDVVVVGVLPSMHPEIAMAAIDNGKPVYVEKPLAETSRECLAIERASRGCKVPLAVGFNRRFAPATELLLQAFRAADKPVSVTYRLIDDVRIRPPEQSWKKECRLLIEAVHIFDLLAYLLAAEPVSVFAAESRFNDSTMQIEFSDGSRATLVCSQYGSLAQPKEQLQAVLNYGAVEMVEFVEFRSFGMSGLPPFGPIRRAALRRLRQQSRRGFRRARNRRTLGDASTATIGRWRSRACWPTAPTRRHGDARRRCWATRLCRKSTTPRTKAGAGHWKASARPPWKRPRPATPGPPTDTAPRHARWRDGVPLKQGSPSTWIPASGSLPTKMDKIRVALIGAGKMANSVHYPSLAAFDDVEIVGLCDLDAERLAATAARFNIAAVFSDYRRMIDATDPDAVYALMPPHHVFDVAADVLERKKHLFIEKPPGVSTLQAESLARLADAAGLVTAVGFQRRYHPLLRGCWEKVSTRAPVNQVVASFYKNSPPAEIHPYFRGAIDILRCDAIHAVDALRYLLRTVRSRFGGLQRSQSRHLVCQ